jgi:nucleoside-diphosphate-sugar epimerase
MINVIIGKRSNLTQKLLSVLDNSLAVSSGAIVKEMDNIDWCSHDVNLILNQFQPAKKLNDFSSPIDYINNAIDSTAKILEFIKSKSININKIIYTSSSSVYGDNKSCHESDALSPISLQSALKIANEKMVIKFCQDMGFDYTIARIFNMYGGVDNFSIISKIINCFKYNQTLTLINNGQSTRDFIHINDVVNIYHRILMVKNLPVVNIASGQVESVKSILRHLQENQIILKTNNIISNEILTSIADNSKLLSIMGGYQFIKVKDHVVSCIKLI